MRTTPPDSVSHVGVSYDPNTDNNGIRLYNVKAQNYIMEEGVDYTLIQICNGVETPRGNLLPDEQRILFLEVDSTFRIDATAPVEVTTVEVVQQTTPGQTV